MTTTIDRIEIGYTLASVTEVDIKINEQQKIDEFLDAIIKLRNFLNERSEWLENLEEQMGKLFRLDYHSLTEDDFFTLEVIHKVCQRLHSELMRSYAQLRPVREQSKIAKKEIARYKEAVDNFQEVNTDLHRAFLIFPHMPAFQKTDKELKALLA